MFRFDSLGRGELTARNTLGPLDDLKFSRSQPSVEIGANLGMGDLTLAAAKAIADQCAFIDNSLALEVLIAGKRKRFSNSVEGVDRLLLM
jgi:hypothetical protein